MTHCRFLKSQINLSHHIDNYFFTIHLNIILLSPVFFHIISIVTNYAVVRRVLLGVLGNILSKECFAFCLVKHWFVSSSELCFTLMRGTFPPPLHCFKSITESSVTVLMSYFHPMDWCLLITCPKYRIFGFFVSGLFSLFLQWFTVLFISPWIDVSSLVQNIAFSAFLVRSSNEILVFTFCKIFLLFSFCRLRIVRHTHSSKASSFYLSFCSWSIFRFNSWLLMGICNLKVQCHINKGSSVISILRQLITSGPI